MDKITKMNLNILNFQKVFKKKNNYNPLYNKEKWKLNSYKGNIVMKEGIFKRWQKQKKMLNKEGKKDKKYNKNIKIKFKSANPKKY